MSIKSRVIEYKNLLTWGFKDDVLNLLMSIPIGIMFLLSWSPLVSVIFIIPTMSVVDIFWVLLVSFAMGGGGTTLTWFMFKVFILETIRIDKRNKEVEKKWERIDAKRARIHS